MSELRTRAVLGIVWSSVHRFGSMIISFLGNIVLTRLLSPEDFGVIGMMMVFIAICNTLIDGGLASALIQKDQVDDIDYSTVFSWNLAISVFFYITLFFTADSISAFYNINQLNDILKVLGLVLLINSLYLVQVNQLMRQLNFKLLALINIAGNLSGVIISIFLAYLGWGVWSLVVKNLTTSVVIAIFCFTLGSWKPSFGFSIKSFKELFGFGSFVLLANLAETIYVNIQALIIGKVFSADQLGYYTQAKKLEEVPTKGLAAVVNQVSFPVFSRLQNDLSKVREGLRNNIKAITFINFPLMFWLIIIAKPLIILLFTERWIDSVPFFQIFCVWGMLYALNTLNTNIVKSLGMGSLYFTIQVGKRVVGLVIIFFGLRFGIMGLMWGVASAAYLSFFVNAFILGKLIGYGIICQIRDVFGSLTCSIIVGILVYFFTPFLHTSTIIIDITLISIAYLALYIGISYLTKSSGLNIYLNVFKRLFKR